MGVAWLAFSPILHAVRGSPSPASMFMPLQIPGTSFSNSSASPSSGSFGIVESPASVTAGRLSIYDSAAAASNFSAAVGTSLTNSNGNGRSSASSMERRGSRSSGSSGAKGTLKESSRRSGSASSSNTGQTGSRTQEESEEPVRKLPRRAAKDRKVKRLVEELAEYEQEKRDISTRSRRQGQRQHQKLQVRLLLDPHIHVRVSWGRGTRDGVMTDPCSVQEILHFPGGRMEPLMEIGLLLCSMALDLGKAIQICWHTASCCCTADPPHSKMNSQKDIVGNHTCAFPFGVSHRGSSMCVVLLVSLILTTAGCALTCAH